MFSRRYSLLLDASEQPLFTEGPPAFTREGHPTGAVPGAVLSEAECPSGWAALASEAGLNMSESEIPRHWTAGGSHNVLRRGRLTLEIELYRSHRFGTLPLVDGESREACLSFGQLRTFSIATGGADNATLYVSVDAPISAMYARRDALPDVLNGLYDARIALAMTPRWGCSDAVCAQPRATFALSASTCAPDAAGLWYVSLAMHDASSLADESALASAAGSDVSVAPSRFHVTMVLFPASADELLGEISPTFVLPAARWTSADTAAVVASAEGSAADAAAAIAAADAAATIGRTVLAGGAMRHLRLLGIPRDLAPRVSLTLASGTLRAIYIQRGRCAISATGLTADGTAESPLCGAANQPDCLVRWMARFNPYDEAKLYELSAELSATAVSEYAAASLPPADWWIGLESTEEDVADLELTITLLKKPPDTEQLCYFARFCPDYADLSARHSVGTRDPDDAIAFARILNSTTVVTWVQARMTRRNMTSLASALAGGLMFLFVVLRVLYPSLKFYAGRWVENKWQLQEDRARDHRLRQRGEAARRRAAAATLQDQTVRRLINEGTHAGGFRGETKSRYAQMGEGDTASEEDD